MSVPRQRHLKAVLVMLAAVLVLGLSSPSYAGTSEDEAQQAAAAIAAARQRANDAADAYIAAQSELEIVELDRLSLEIEIDELEKLVEQLREAIEDVAIKRFAGSGSIGIPILTDTQEPTDQLLSNVLVGVVADDGNITIDDYEAAEADLRQARRSLLDVEDEIEQRQADLLELQAEAEAEVAALREIEEQRLNDEAVQRALEAQAAEQAHQLEEIKKFEAERARAAAEQADDQATGVDPNIAVAAGIPASNAPVVEGADSSSGFQARSGGTVGGRTGGGGLGNSPHLIDGIVCPVGGPSAYGDSWGAPRSGGRRHQGVDMLAPNGTPLVAVTAGVVSHSTNRLGGITISLQGFNGNRYYYAHLLSYEGVPGPVAQGQVIGYIGESGNATGTPHLHFEIRPGGGVPVNPYPSVRGAGC